MSQLIKAGYKLVWTNSFGILAVYNRLFAIYDGRL